MEPPRGFRFRRGWEWPTIIVGVFFTLLGLAGVLFLREQPGYWKAWSVLVSGVALLVFGLGASLKREWRP